LRAQAYGVPVPEAFGETPSGGQIG
jgi:hypothetical protein